MNMMIFHLMTKVTAIFHDCKMERGTTNHSRTYLPFRLSFTSIHITWKNNNHYYEIKY